MARFNTRNENLEVGDFVWVGNETIREYRKDDSAGDYLAAGIYQVDTVWADRAVDLCRFGEDDCLYTRDDVSGAGQLV
jgi:hypothetical protein